MSKELTNPTMSVGTIEMVPVEWILQNVNYSVDGFSYNAGNGWYIDWAELVQGKSYDSEWNFNRVCETIQRQGFRIPIVLDLCYAGNEGMVTMGNGHHRLTYAILFALDSIPVYWAYGDYMSEDVSERDEYEMVEGDWVDFGDMWDW